MTIQARRLPRGACAFLLALTLIVIAAVPGIAQATTIYPDNKITGTSFDLGLDDWTELPSSCVLLGGIPSTNPQVCNAHTTHSAGIGTPPGSLQQDYNGSASGLGALLFSATASAQSETFTMGPNINGATGVMTFAFDRRADVNTILNIDGYAQYEFTLHDLTAGTSVQLYKEDVDDTDNIFAGALRTELPNAVPGHAYRVDLKTIFRCGVVCAALQETTANFDNLRLRVDDGTPGFGPATAETLEASDITDDAATLNGITNAQGLAAEYTFRYAGTAAEVTSGAGTVTGPHNAGSRLDDQLRSRDIAGLVACEDYFFRIEATNEESTPTTGLGAVETFRTDCAPSVETLAATGVGSTSATLNSAVNPEIFLETGPETTYFYEYRVKDSAGPFTKSAAGPPISGGRRVVQLNSVVISGLTKDTNYEARVVAKNNVGETTDPTPIFFLTIGDGAQGPPGQTGQTGQTGPQGGQGNDGAAGTPGTPGARGPQGAAGPPGTPTGSGSSILNLLSGDKRAMVRIDSKTIRVPRRGRFRGRTRVKIFCRPIAVRTCSGNMKVRSVKKINPAGLGLPRRPARRVTFETSPVQLDSPRIGFAILELNEQRMSLLERISREPGGGTVEITIIVSVIDADNNRQNVRRTATLGLARG